MMMLCLYCYRVQTLNSDKDVKTFEDFDFYLLPFFIPQFATIVLHPVAVAFTLADAYLSQTQSSGSVLTILTTIAVSFLTISNIIVCAAVSVNS